MWFFQKQSSQEDAARLAQFEGGTGPLLDGLENGAVNRAQVLASSYEDLHDCRTKVEGLRDRTRAAQKIRVVDLSIFQEIKLTENRMAMHIEEFDLMVENVAIWRINQIQEIDILRNAFESLRVALGLLHGVLEHEPT